MNTEVATNGNNAIPIEVQTVSPEMREKIITFLNLTNISAMTDGLIESLTGQFRAGFETGFGESLPKAPSEALTLVEQTLKDRREAFIDSVVGIYAKHFTEGDMDNLIAFYRSVTGTRLLEISVPLATEIAEASNRWGDEGLKSIEVPLTKILE